MRRVGIRNAQGKYLVFLDADDYFTESSVLDKLYQEVEKNCLDVLSFETELLYEGEMKKKDNKDFYYYKTHFYPGIRNGKEFFIDMMSNQEYCDSACLLLVKKDWMLKKEICFYPGILYEDALFCMRCFIMADRMAHISERFYTYRIREKSIMTSNVRWENVRSRIVVYREILRLIFLYGEEDSRLKEPMTEYLLLIASHAKYMDEFRIDEPSDERLDSLDILLIKMMELGKYRIEVNEEVILAGLEKLAADSEGVILYGAGEVGRMFFRFLDDKGLSRKVLCYAVSEKTDGTSTVDNIPVLSINEAVKMPGQIVLSVIAYKARTAMQKILEELGVHQFQSFDQYIYRALRHYTQLSNIINTQKEEKNE